ncbi:hypothetical protein Tco_0527891 [Tanacetum coccineum]
MVLKEKWTRVDKHTEQENSARGAGAVGYGRAQNRVGNANPGQARQVKCYNCNGFGHIAETALNPSVHKTPNTSKTRCFKCKSPIEWGNLGRREVIVPLKAVDWTKLVMKMCMSNLSRLALNVDNAHDHYQDAVYNDLHDSDVRSVSHTPRNTVANNLLNAELATYKEQVKNCKKDGPRLVKEQNTRPIKALTVYPPNTPATLVPRVFPTKSQVKINIFTLRQLFLEFDKTCKKRITPTGITEGERGFEQTKTCKPITESFHFSIPLQEHFEGIQKALTKEVKEMSNAFDELEAELDQNLLALKEVNTLQEQNELFRAENAKIKQHYKELYDSIKITRAKHTEQTTALKSENESLKVQIQNTVSYVTTTQFKPKVTAPGKYALDVEPIPPRNRNKYEFLSSLTQAFLGNVDTLCDIEKTPKLKDL